MASAELSRRVENVVSYPPLSELGDLQRRELYEALLKAATFEDMAGGDHEGGTEPAEAAARQRRLGVVECRWECRESLSSALVDRPPGVSPLRGRCLIRTIWRRPPQGHAGIVSARVGTSLHVTFPHPWQTCSATPGMSSRVPDSAPSTREVRSQRQTVKRTGCSTRSERPRGGAGTRAGRLSRPVLAAARTRHA